MSDIVPAIIPKSLDDLATKAEAVAPFVKTAQVDIMDGKFAPEPSFPFIEGDFEKLAHNVSKHLRIGFELDMMVLNPEKHIDAWIPFGVQTFIIHFESTKNHQKLIDQIKEKGKGVALAFKPNLDITNLDPFIEQVDFVQCMGNEKIGYHGVELSDDALHTIERLRIRYPHSIISVDIGVNLDSAHRLKEAGANKLVSGSAIYHSDNIEIAIQKLALA